MIRLVAPPCLLGLLVCCAGTDDSDGLALGALEGSYDITEAVDGESRLYEVPTPSCLLRVSGSHVTSDCSKASAQESETFRVDARVRESLVSGELVYVRDRGPSADCYASNIEIATIVISASKESGAQVDGVFAPLAGSWAGSLTIEMSYEQELLEGAPSYCVSDLALYAFDFDVSVAGSTAQIMWSGEGEQGVLDVVGTENAISVNGSVVSK